MEKGEPIWSAHPARLTTRWGLYVPEKDEMKLAESDYSGGRNDN